MFILTHRTAVTSFTPPSLARPTLPTPQVSLHIYAPPFRECQIFVPTSGEAKTVSMVPANSPAYAPAHATTRAASADGALATARGGGPAFVGGEEKEEDHGPLFYPQGEIVVEAAGPESVVESAAGGSKGHASAVAVDAVEPLSLRALVAALQDLKLASVGLHYEHHHPQDTALAPIRTRRF